MNHYVPNLNIHQAKSMPILNEKPLGTSKKSSPEKPSKHKTPVNIRKKSINEE